MTATKSQNYIAAVGRRKTSTARVRITEAAKNSITINDKAGDAYFATKDLVKVAMESLYKLKDAKTYSITVIVKGGGVHSQAEAIRHGIARALAKTTDEVKTEVKKLGYLKRDARSKERRKFGHKKARKSSQWSKR
jgi:small subunit ribosomal protein S9